MTIKKYKTYILLFCFFFMVMNIGITRPLSLLGTMKIKGTGRLSYKLEVNINSSSQLSGISVTDVKGKNETISEIKGSYDSVNHVLSFREVVIISPKHKKLEKSQTFCYVHASLKRRNAKDAAYSFSGKFKGYYDNGKDVCATGEIEMADLSSLFNRLEELSKKNEAANRLKKQIEKELSNTDPSEEEKTDETPQEKVVSKDSKERFYWKGTALEISAWDNGDLDGDKIAILLNGQVIVPSLLLSNIPKKTHCVLQKGHNEISIKAMNGGRMPPNSSKIILRGEDGEEEEFVSLNDEGDASLITIIVP